MKNGQVIKSKAENTVEEELALINSYSRRELSPEEVYIFSVVLCDNDIDRDYERFTVEALFELEKLFVGKTGIIDHEPSAKNQKARIISCRVEAADGEKTALGDQLFRLTARAYILKSEGNEELIKSIEAGIVREVSVGCSISHTLCSVCRNDMRSSACTHQKGKSYNGTLCYGELSEATDAYEFSFVAVPAQRKAGVIKTGVKEKSMDSIKKQLKAEGEVLLSRKEAEKLDSYISALEAETEYAKAYKEELSGRLKTALKEKGIELDFATESCVLRKLSIKEAKALLKAFDKADRKPVTQLGSQKTEKPLGNTEFRI